MRLFITALGAAMLSSCSSLLYYPTQQLHFPPKRFGVAPEDVHFTSADGTKLFGWLLRADPQPKKGPRAVFLFYHGNGENLSSHYISLLWALKQGFDYFIFDYRGYGRSEGSPSPKGTVADGEAALRWLHARYPNTPLIIFGQSLGGAIALRNAIDLKSEIPFRAVVIESSFASYQDVARRVLARSILTWPFQWLAYLALSDRYAPEEEIAKISPLPMLVMHNTEDGVVPFSAGEKLFRYAAEPKEFWSLPGNIHGGNFLYGGDAFQRRFLDWLKAHGL